VAKQISEGEFALTEGPLQFVGRDTLRDPVGPLMDLAKIFQEATENILLGRSRLERSFCCLMFLHNFTY
jgi:hypothetical protein